jgi:hypothetical protein
VNTALNENQFFGPSILTACEDFCITRLSVLSFHRVYWTALGLQDLRFSHRWLWKLLTSAIYRREVHRKSIDISEEHVASIFRIFWASERLYDFQRNVQHYNRKTEVLLLNCFFLSETEPMSATFWQTSIYHFVELVLWLIRNETRNEFSLCLLPHEELHYEHSCWIYTSLQK